MALSGRGQLILLKRAGRVQHRQELRAGQGSCRRYETVAWSRRGGGGGGKQIDHQEHRQQQPFSASSSWQQQPAALFALGGKEHSSNDPPLQLASNSGMRIATAAPMILAKRNLWNCSRGQVRSFVSGVCDSKRADPAKEEVLPPSNYDQVGPPDPLSNLRRHRLYVPPNESALHEKYRLLREDTLKWSGDFWKRHNTEFAHKREEFVSKILKERYPDEPSKKTVSADEMSEYYKLHLDSNWRGHLDFNVEWQRRNFTILALSVMVGLENMFRLQ